MDIKTGPHKPSSPLHNQAGDWKFPPEELTVSTAKGRGEAPNWKQVEGVRACSLRSTPFSLQPGSQRGKQTDLQTRIIQQGSPRLQAPSMHSELQFSPFLLQVPGSHLNRAKVLQTREESPLHPREWAPTHISEETNVMQGAGKNSPTKKNTINTHREIRGSEAA